MEDSQYFIVIALESILGGLEIYIDILLIFRSRNANMEKKNINLFWSGWKSYWKHVFDTEVPLPYVYVEDCEGLISFLSVLGVMLSHKLLECLGKWEKALAWRTALESCRNTREMPLWSHKKI